MGNKRKVRDDFSDFKDIYLLILSIIHGGLFFVYLEKMNEIFKDGISIESVALVAFLFCIFMRIFQSQLLAALKYSSWKLRFMDLFIVFFVAITEHQLLIFSADKATSNFITLIRVMSILGFFSYLFTYIRIKNQKIKNETSLQTINMLIPLFVFIISVLLKNHMSVFYVLSSILLIFNIHASLCFSGYLR